MTVTSTATKVVFQGNGATTVWPYTFPMPEAADLVLTLVTIASGNEAIISPVNYTVTDIGNDTGGTVTYPLSGSPVSSAFEIVIERALPLTQQTDLLNQGAVYPQDIEDALDYLTMLAQQLQDQINRAIVFSVADTVETTLPAANARANLFLGFNANGDPVAVSGLTAGTTVSAAMIPVVTAVSTAAALTALGIPGSLLDALIPAGVVWDYAGITAPTGFVLAFGQACTSTYPTLRALLVAASSPFGTNGTDPLLPDLRARAGVGKSNMGGTDNGLWTGGTVLGAVAGTQSVTLTLAQIPTGITSPITITPGGSFPNIPLSSGVVGSLQTSSTATVNITPANSSGNWTSVTSLSGTATSNNTGGLSHENRMPGLILNKIIKAH